jgi:RNA polymerase sigma factor (sigma-70 family)
VTTIPTPLERRHRDCLYHFLRVQMPRLALPRDRFDDRLEQAFAIYAPKVSTPLSWTLFFEGFHCVDWSVAAGCLEGSNPAWEALFAARTGRSDLLLVDALRSRAARLYPRDAERQESAVDEFWTSLIVSDNGARPVLARYDGQRPLAPWLIRVFQNWHLSKLRQSSDTVPLPDDDLAVSLPIRTHEETRWHEAFRDAARAWLDTLGEPERVLLGLRWRYKLSQRDVAGILGVHEGTISRQTDKLRDQALETLTGRMISAGWTGDDVEPLILGELGAVLTDDPRLSAEALRHLLGQKSDRLAI